jgi:hypothetical protein
MLTQIKARRGHFQRVATGFYSAGHEIGKKNAGLWRPATYEEVLRGMKLEEPNFTYRHDF